MFIVLLCLEVANLNPLSGSGVEVMNYVYLMCIVQMHFVLKKNLLGFFIFKMIDFSKVRRISICLNL